MKTSASFSGAPSFALISVLALVSLAALTATAFLASARLERTATRSIGSQTQLDMVLQAGAEMARAAIDTTFQDPFLPAIVTCFRANPTNDLGYLLLGKPTNDSAAPPNILFYPVFSHARVTNLSLDGSQSFPMTNVTVPHQGMYSSVIATMMGSLTNNFGSAALASNYVRIPLVSATGTTPTDQDWSPAVGWITLSAKLHPTNTSNSPYARVAFFVQDMSGLIDAERMGGLTNRDTGTNPAEISVTNAFGTSLTNNTAMTNANNRRFYLSPSLLRTNAGLTNLSDLRYVASGLRSSSVWSNLIPYGVAVTATKGYALAGSNRLALNAAGTTVQALVSNLSTNLPDFTNRAGGMNGTNYLYALAANIIDYVDTDAMPTTVTTPAGDPIVGFDNYPLPTLIFDRMSFGGTTFTMKDYWQFWNCSSLTSPAAAYQITYNFVETFYAYVTTNTTTKNAPVTNFVAGSPRLVTSAFVTNITIPQLDPGGSFITNVNSTNVNLANPPFNLPNISPPLILLNIWVNGINGNIINLNPFVISDTNGKTITQAKTGYERKAKTITNGGTTPDWSGGMPGLRYDNVTGSFKVPPSGDPRMLNYLTNNNNNGYLSACDYDKNVEWGLGFAQTRNSVFNGFPYSGTPANWVDGPKSSASLVNGTPYPDATAPTLGISSAKVPPIAKLSTNTTGLFTNICELGNIFDPMQWVSTSIANPSAWVDCDIAAGTTWSANSMYGGGQTLRIGRREHSRFAFTNFGGLGSIPSPAMGTAASSFLDLFCLSNSTVDNGGKINLNTAPGPVLAALAGGITLQRDPNKTGKELNSTMVTAFTNGVMKFRSVYPFITPSQLAFLSGTNVNGAPTPSQWTNSAVFSTNSLAGLPPGGLNGPTSLNDEGREEWFAKMFGLSSATSFNFRVYVVAQLLNAQGQPTSSLERRMFHIYCNYNASGTNSTKQIGEYLY